MTVATTLNFVTYTGDAVAVTFPFTFPVYDEDHLALYLRDTTTKVLTLVNPSVYSVAGVGNENGGSVTLDTAPAATTNLLIVRTVPLTQDLDVDNQGGFYPENFENELDLIEMQLQQHDESIGRSVRGQVTEAWPDLPPPPERAGKFLGFDNTANAHPTVDTEDLLFTLIGSILAAGPGISISVSGGIITITNTVPEEGNSWLLESGTSGSSVGDAEFIRDTVFAALIGVGCTITQDDPGNTITITVSGALDLEGVYDAIATAVTAGTGITVVDDDGANTTTISADPEFIRDTIGTALIGGVGITAAIDDAGNTITLNTVPDILDVVSAATVTPTFAYNQVNVTAQAVNLTIANPTGTAVDGHGIIIRIKDNGTSRTLTWGAQFRAFNDALPTATVISKTLYVGVVYNLADDKWDLLGVRSEA